MRTDPLQVGNIVVMEAEHLGQLLAAISSCGYELVGPTVQEGAIVYDRLNSVHDLPRGWTDEQEPGKYRLTRREDRAYFSYNVGPHSWKKFLHPPEALLWKCEREGTGFKIIPDNSVPPKRAFIGARACELQAIGILDRVLLGSACCDPGYKARRENVLVVAVNCSQAGRTCFCASMNTGPRASGGYDLALTEVLEPGAHRFVVEIGSIAGAEVIAKVPHRSGNAADAETVSRVVESTKAQMGRAINTEGLKELLYRNYEHPQWDNVATRCLTCANCTMVCPTCFCTNVEDVADLTGQKAERWRKWDSCFTMDFSYVHGGSVRATPKSRYRQWITHKLATWVDQFGEFGCVGCGRCITWCPVGIDITEEIHALRESEGLTGNTRKEAP
jgi:sulfhydrogenase subunit beta (sulfur reductase)